MSATPLNMTEHQVENFLEAFLSSPQYETFLNYMDLGDDFDIETLTTQYNAAIRDFKRSEEGNQYAHIPYEIQLSGISSLLENRDRSGTINYSWALFFYSCLCSISYGFRCEHPNPEPSMSFCTFFPRNELDPFKDNIYCNRTVVQSYYYAIGSLVVLTSAMASSGVSLPTFVHSILSRNVPLAFASHSFALFEVAYRRWQEEVRRVVNQPYPRSIQMSEGDSEEDSAEDDDSLQQLHPRQDTSRGPT